MSLCLEAKFNLVQSGPNSEMGTAGALRPGLHGDAERRRANAECACSDCDDGRQETEAVVGSCHHQAVFN